MLQNLIRPETPVTFIVISWMGITAACVLAILGVFLLLRKTHAKGKAVFLLAVSIFTALFFIQTLTRFNFFACCWSDTSTLLLYAGILLPQLYFIWDGWRILRRREEG